ncbi:uncharacterized protein [Prorops nasuta]|uniref:uncharacterized protein isoform X2 n=1 Tax=Prorops nasuta TaxID=863751 RepID=UPI0034CD31F6
MQCGLCAVVADLFRRAMCIAGSRRGSGESIYQELATDYQTSKRQQFLHHHHHHHHHHRYRRRHHNHQQQDVHHRHIVQDVCPTAPLVNSAPLAIESPDKLFKKVVKERNSCLQERQNDAEITLESTDLNATLTRVHDDAAAASTSPSRTSVVVEAVLPALEIGGMVSAPPVAIMETTMTILSTTVTTTTSTTTSTSASAADTTSLLSLLNQVYVKDTKTDAIIVKTRRLSDVDRTLINCLDTGEFRPRHAGRFLTMHRRRRKRLVTRLLNQEPAILDDIFHGLAQCILQRAGNWRFNAFTLETVTGGRSLPVLCVHLFHWYGLLQHFSLDVVTVWKLFAFIEEGYHSTNPYHNSIHATDVTQAMHCFLQEEKIRKHLTNLEIMASLIAAVTHDLDHPGVNQPFLVATSNHLAALYQNTSVLENHHWRSAIGCLLESGVSDQLPPEIRPELQQRISSLILATDITRQQEFLTRFKDYLDSDSLDMQQGEHRHFILQIALKCADISNPCRPWDISRKWSYKVCEEFFRQGDYERRLKLPVTPLCDRHSTSIPRIQVGFLKFVVTPLYEEWHRFLGDGLSVSLMEFLRGNQNRWENLINHEPSSDATRREILELEENGTKEVLGREEEIERENQVDLVDEEMDQMEVVSDDEEDSESIDLVISGRLDQNNPRRTSLPGRHDSVERVGRRHSVPLSMPKPLIVFSSSNSRRESLPTTANSDKIKNPLLKLGDESLLDPSTLSLLSSRSSVLESSTNASTVTERPVSAENLLPETSIASITNSTEASRLSTVLQPDNQRPLGAVQSKLLTRQQTFPPLQPYVRTRYLSTTAEMSQCSTQLSTEDNRLSSSSSTNSIKEKKTCSGGGCGSPPSGQGIARTSKTTQAKGQSLSTHCAKNPRRHSMQVIRTDDGSRYRLCNKRPSSAQESDSAQIFYASLTSSYSGKDMVDVSNNSELSSVPSCAPRKSLPENLTTLLTSHETSESTVHQITRLKCDPDTSTADADIEFGRRHSTSVAESRIAYDNTGRRFTTIPVSSELLFTQKKFFIGSPPDSPPLIQTSSSSNSGNGLRKSIDDPSYEITSADNNKRNFDVNRERVQKLARLSFDAKMKENVDPRIFDDKGYAPTRRGIQIWTRRGSAPVGLLSKMDDVTVTSTSNTEYTLRRGSVPTDIIKLQGSCNRTALGPRGDNLSSPGRRASLPKEMALGELERNHQVHSNNNNNNINNNNHHRNINSNKNGTSKANDASAAVTCNVPVTRRGSVPTDDVSEWRRDLFNRSSINGKSRDRKKILRRRSSEGPDMLRGASNDGNENGIWLRWKRELAKKDSAPESILERRGSLPIEVAAVSHAGRYNHR